MRKIMNCNRTPATKILFFLIVLFLTLGISGCSGIDGDLMSKSEVLKQVKRDVSGEKYKLVEVKHDTDKRPKEDTYYFESKDRDMSFQALSTLRPLGIDDSTFGYGKYVYTGYADGVHALYRDDIDETLSRLSADEDGQYYYESYLELENIIHVIVEADDIYKSEANYNSYEWMKENPVENIKLYYRYSDENGETKQRQMFAVNLDGSCEYEQLYDLCTYKHVNNIINYGLTDGTIPASEYGRVHAEKLKDIYIDSTNVSEAAYEDAKQKNLINNSRENSSTDHYAAYYYYPRNTYVVMLNVALASEDCAPQLIENYTKAMGIDCTVKYGQGKVEWKNDGKLMQIEAHQDKNKNIISCSFKCDGDDLGIEYITNDDSLSPVRATYLVGITVQDLANLFGLTYEIDEEKGELKFHS